MCISFFLCSLSPNATNKKIRNRFADVKFYYYLCAVYELFNQITLIKMKKTIVMTLALLMAGCLSAGAQSIYHVSRENGSNKNDGSKTAPFKNLQKALDVADDGATILVAEGNYFGMLNSGTIDIRKPVTIKGGYNGDFTERDVLKYKTMIQPSAESNGSAHRVP